MARILMSRIERQSPVTIEERPLNVSLEPNGLLGFRLKGLKTLTDKGRIRKSIQPLYYELN